MSKPINRNLSLDQLLGGKSLKECETMTEARARAKALVQLDRDSREKSRLSDAGRRQLEAELGQARRILDPDRKIDAEEVAGRGTGFLRKAGA